MTNSKEDTVGAKAMNPDNVPDLESGELRERINALASRAQSLTPEEIRQGVRMMIELRSRARSAPRGKAASKGEVVPLSLDEL